jgi:hypothetical protein
MKRRDALRNMGLGLGYAVATPAFISILESCSGEAAATGYQAVLFSKDQFNVLTTMVDVIIPKTDSPSASEVNVPMFIDKYISETQPKGEVIEKGESGMDIEASQVTAAIGSNTQEGAKAGIAAFITAALEISGKSKASDLDATDIDATLAATLKAEGDLEGNLKNAAIFAGRMRGMAMSAYKNSEEVGERVLAYLPIPGEYIACGNLEELTKGKVWSL